MKRKPINTTSDGCSFAIRARYDACNLDALTSGGGYYPCTGVMEYDLDDTDEGKGTSDDGKEHSSR